MASSSLYVSRETCLPTPPQQEHDRAEAIETNWCKASPRDYVVGDKCSAHRESVQQDEKRVSLGDSHCRFAAPCIAQTFRLLVNACQTFGINRQCDLGERWRLARGRCLHRCRPTRHPTKQEPNDQPEPTKQQRRPARGQPAKASLPRDRHKQPQSMRCAAVGG